MGAWRDRLKRNWDDLLNSSANLESLDRALAAARADLQAAADALAACAGKEEWEETFTLRFEVLDGDTGTVVFGEAVSGQFTFTLDRSTDPTGTVGVIEGRGRGTRTTFGGRSGDCAVQYTRPPENITLTVQGALYQGSFWLAIADPTPSTATFTLTCPDFTEGGTAPWSGAEAVHPFAIQLPPMDGGRFTINESFGGWRAQGELTVRRRAGTATRSSAPVNAHLGR